MEIREGYKQTGVGLIPEDWEVKTIGQLGTFSKGMGIRKDEAQSGNIPCVRYGELYTLHNEYIKSFGSFISDEVAKTSKKLKKGDILFAGSGETKEEIGKCAAFIDDIEAYVGGDVIILSPKYGEALFYGYLFNLPLVAKQKANKGQGDAIVHISASSLSDILLSIPTLPEQQAIVTALSDIDGLIDSLSKLIEKKKKIKQGAMQELLTGKNRLEGFSGEWVEVKIGEICEKIIDNRGKTPPLTNKGVPLLETNTIKDDTKYPLYEYVSKYVTNNTYKTWFRDHVKKGDILVSTVGMVGETALLSDYKCAIAQNLIGLRISKFAVEDFVFYQTKMPTFKMQVKAVLMGAVQPSLKVPHLLNFHIRLPKSKEEQTAIATILSDMDSEIETLQAKLDKFKAIKQGIMQELLTGRIRLLKGA